MALYRKSELLAFLDELGTAPKKSLSQNFLIDGNIVDKILATANVEKGDLVLEIGPGPGVLTEALVARGASVIAVEKDQLFAQALSRFAVDVHEADILEFDFTHIPKRCKVISNLPYHLTSPIMGRLAPRFDLFSSITVMVQEEMAQRMCFEKSSFSLFLEFYCELTYAFKVKRQLFYPAPKIDSAVVQMVTRDVHAPEGFFSMIRQAYGQRRKMLRASLGTSFGKERVERVLWDMGLSEKTRPEELTLEQFLKFQSLLVASKPA